MGVPQKLETPISPILHPSDFCILASAGRRGFSDTAKFSHINIRAMKQYTLLAFFSMQKWVFLNVLKKDIYILRHNSNINVEIVNDLQYHKCHTKENVFVQGPSNFEQLGYPSMHEQSRCVLPAVDEKVFMFYMLNICQRSNLIIEYSFGNILMFFLILRI